MDDEDGRDPAGAQYQEEANLLGEDAPAALNPPDPQSGDPMPATRDHVTTDCLAITGESVARGVDILTWRTGRFPDRNRYGLGGDACNADAVAAIFAAKERPSFNPLISHVASATMRSNSALQRQSQPVLPRHSGPGQ